MAGAEARFHLNVDSLSVEFRPAGSIPVSALRDVTFTLGTREIVGILGESGSGKSTLALSLLGLVQERGGAATGSVVVNGAEVLTLPARHLRDLRGRTIALVFQESALSLNPVMPVGKQVAEVLRAHQPRSWKWCLTEARAILQEFFREETDRVFAALPHQLSGGQRQRVLIAQAVANRPQLLIADEPTASLDVGIQLKVLMLLRRYVSEHAMSLMLISHDPRILRLMADRVFVMQDGHIIEAGPVDSVFTQPRHSYTRTLLQLCGLLPPDPCEFDGH